MNQNIHTPATCRISRDTKNKDGWTARMLSDSKLSLIHNIDEVITELSPGQLWEAEIIASKDTYNIIQLTSLVRA